MKIFLRILTEIWQFPQHIIAYVIILINCKSIKLMVSKDGISHYLVDHLFDSAISLGNYIFLDSDRSVSKKAVKHEYGHQLQSKRLGWLYLIIIGIPSVIGNIIYRKTKFKPYGDYYKQPWEKWADELGNVNRY